MMTSTISPSQHYTQTVVLEPSTFFPLLDDEGIGLFRSDHNGSSLYMDAEQLSSFIENASTSLGSQNNVGTEQGPRIMAYGSAQDFPSSSKALMDNSRRQNEPPFVEISLIPIDSDVCDFENEDNCHRKINSSRENLRLNTGSSYRRHDEQEMESGTCKRSFSCDICSRKFQKWPQYKRHKLDHMDEKLYKCNICNEMFNFDENLKVHRTLHDAELSGCLQCQFCPTKFSRLASLKSHLRVHKIEENLVCQECGDEFPTKARLESHLDEHKTRHPQCMVYRCRSCPRSFTQAALLQDHMKEHDAMRQQLKVLKPRRKKTKPKKSLSITNEIKTESNTISTESAAKKRKNLCNICNKGFEKPSQLDRHFRIHTGEKPFQCKLCDKSFNQKGTLESHIQSMHQRLKPHVCELCMCRFSQKGNLKAHVLKVHVLPEETEKVFKCQECSCVYRRLATLNNHIAKAHMIQKKKETESNPNKKDPLFSCALIKTDQAMKNLRAEATTQIKSNPSHPSNEEVDEAEVNLAHDDGKLGRCTVKIKKVGKEKWHVCSFCSKGFKKPSDLIRHIRTHTNERPYSCNICGRSFAVKSTLKTHLRTHLPNKELECKTCHKTFNALASLKAHERLHTGAKPYQCRHCNKFFRTTSQRKVHLKVHYRNNGMPGRRRLLRIGENEPGVELSEPLKITEKGLVPVMNRALQTYLGKENPGDAKVRPYKCNQCPAGFKKSSHLKQHLRSHSGERPYQCAKCLRSFVSSGVLKNHIRTHENIRGYKCHVCHSLFTTNGSLKRHMATHSNLRPFICPYCHKSFKTSVACRKHIKTHKTEVVALQSSTAGLDNVFTHRKLDTTSSAFNIDLNGLSYAEDDLIHDYDSTYITSSLPQSHPEEELDVASMILANPNDTIGQAISNLHDSAASCITSDQPSQAAFRAASFNEPDSLEEQIVQNYDPVLPEDNLVSDNTLDQCMANLDEELTHIITGTGNSMDHASLDDGEPSSMGISVENSGKDAELESELSQAYNSIFSLSSNNFDLQTLFPPSDCSVSDFVVNEDFSMSDADLSSLQIKEESIAVQPSSSHKPKVAKKSEKKKSVVAKMSTSRLKDFPAKKKPKAAGTSSNIQGAETEEIERIRQNSRPISEKIYNELKEQANQNMQTTEAISKYDPNDPARTNKCQFCGRAFKKRSDMIRHVRIHTNEKPFKCMVCGKAFRVKSTREAHLRTHNRNVKTVSCHVCNNLFSTKSSLRVHLRLHTGTKPYKCPHCDRSFRTSGHRKAHVLSHLKSSHHSKSRSSLVMNLPNRAAIVTPPKTEYNSMANGSTPLLPPVQTIKDKTSVVSKCAVSIDTPDQIFLNGSNTMNIVAPEAVQQQQLIDGVQLAVGEGSFQNYQIAGLDLGSLQLDDNLLQGLGNVILMPSGGHVSNVIGVAMPEINLIEGDGANALQILDTNYQSLPIVMDKESLGTDGAVQSLNGADPLTELETNEMGMPISGLITGSDFPMNGHPTIGGREMTLHSAPDVSSSAEDKTTINKSGSLAEINNKGANSKKCGICHKEFTKPSQLSRHMRTHSGERPYKCTQCSSTFAQSNSLRMHQYTHMKEKPFACPLCEFKTVQKTSLKKHCLKAHPNVAWEDVLSNTKTKSMSVSNVKSVSFNELC